jgi:hypothetical protein
MPAETAALEPPLEPPGVLAGSHGLRVTPSAGLAVYAQVPNSGAAVLPMGMAPAARSRATWMASRSTGGRPANQREPRVVGMPAQSSRSFTPKGTPASGPSASAARRHSRSTASACAAPSASGGRAR